MLAVFPIKNESCLIGGLSAAQGFYHFSTHAVNYLIIIIIINNDLHISVKDWVMFRSVSNLVGCMLCYVKVNGSVIPEIIMLTVSGFI